MTYSNSSEDSRTDYFESKENTAYGTKQKKQGNFEDAYQENIYDRSNLADNAWTDTAAKPNPQLEL